MSSSLIRGIVYTVFDEKAGPTPHVWLPATLSYEMIDKITFETFNMNICKDKIMKPLCYIPIPNFKIKVLLKMFEYKDVTKRGHAVKTTLALLFNEEDDLIFYKYVREFETVFDAFAIQINELQEAAAGKAALEQKIRECYDVLDKTIGHLRTVELAMQDWAAFPGDDLKSQGATAGTVKYKIIVCGDPAVGKTSTILQYTNKAFKRTYMPTLGVNLTEKHLARGDQRVNCIIWDVAGQSKFSTFRKQFYSGAHGAVLVYDVTNQASFQSIKGWYKDVKSVVGAIPIVVLGNKKDLELERKVTLADLEQLGKELSVKTLETSAKTGDNVDVAFETIADQLS